jgi:hypothetical protein
VRCPVPEARPEQEKEKTIYINKQAYKTKADELSGTQILELAGLSPDQYDLFHVKDDGKSEQIGPNQLVKIRNDLRFNAITKGVNFG